MFAEIASNDRDLADVLFLIAIVLAGVGLGVRLAMRQAIDVTEACAIAAIGLVAAGLLVL